MLSSAAREREAASIAFGLIGLMPAKLILRNIPCSTRTAVSGAAFVISIALFLAYWHTLATGAFSLVALGLSVAIVAAALLLGGLSLRFAAPDLQARGWAFQFLLGYLLLSTLLFVLSLVSPLGPVLNFSVLLGIGACAALIQRSEEARDASGPQSAVFVCVVISGLAATIWASDALKVSFEDGELTVFTLWWDSFFHARQISEFSHAHGLSTLSNIRMAGAQPSIYHYAVYAVPAVIAAGSTTGAYEVYASFVLPFGILLSGLAAFSLAGFLWGPWAGLAATVGVLLLPDAYQQGLGTRYLSYNFLQQVNTGGLYGVAFAALSWIFVLHACRTGRVSSVLNGWVVALLLIVHKAHLFVANAFLIMIYPCLFFTRLERRARVVAAVFFVALFLLAVWVSQRFPVFPTLRLDGSGAWSYMHALVQSYDEGAMKSLIRTAFEDPGMPAYVRALFYAGVIVVSTFGAWVVVFAFVLYRSRRTDPAAFLALPLVVFANYLVMSLGLALNRSAVGEVDELLNRPSVWAYFVLVTWTCGALYARVFKTRLPESTTVRAALALSVALAFLFPFAYAANLQTFPAWPGYASYREHSGVPTCLVRAAPYIRARSTWDEVIQDSEGDAKLVLTALAERPEYVARPSDEADASPPLKARLQSLSGLHAMASAEDVLDFARARGISWYVLRESTAVDWPASLLARAEFSCGGLRVFRFAAQ